MAEIDADNVDLCHRTRRAAEGPAAKAGTGSQGGNPAAKAGTGPPTT